MVAAVSNPTRDDRILEVRQAAENFQTDCSLIERSIIGDREAFSILAKRYYHLVFAKALSILGVPEEAEDACQEAFIKGFRYLRTIKEPAKFGFWMRSIVKQESCSRAKKKSKSIALLTKIGSESQTGAPIDAFEKQRRLYHRQLFHHAIQPLSEKAREIVLLHYMSGLSCEEIAAHTQLRPGTIKSHLFKARKKMLNYLTELGVKSIDDI